ncbi:IclR family transcriptional regulator [Pseudoxanthomonas gei]|uniref:IclR family transcriptional regulator n=1 Tax=Pseudoxanthomonas gei TaxID=1383030 RepID=A0ABX0AGZ0_9GAMM|nr:IclR family transcriptional regulator C-terminal domain-containing protein [Pseudoxanthomonas gei]NDK39847.1 IclR family transcriptional regulator [Pseudoxanthomonas gei]
MAAEPFEKSPDYVQSLARSLQVLRAFGHELPTPSLSDLATRTNLSRAVVRRILLTLQHLGYVDVRGRSFHLTPRVLELGYSYLSSLDVSELAQQTMEKLAQQVGESCSMAVLDGSDIVYVLRVPVRRVMSIALGVGARLPAFAASMGRVMLADLAEPELDAWIHANPLQAGKFHAYTPRTLRTPRALKAELQAVRKQGYAMVSQELELGLCSIAVPIRAANGCVVAGLNVSMQYSDKAAARALKEILPALRAAQPDIEQAIRQGGWAPHVYRRQGL